MLWMNRYKVTYPKVLLKCRTFFIICQSLDFLQSKIGKICYLIISEFFGRNYTLCNFDTLCFFHLFDFFTHGKAPFLITCGTEDQERFQISRHFIYRYREHGGLLLWKYFPNSGHELSKEALELAKVWFDDLLSCKKVIAYGEDDTRQIKPRLDTEFRNPLYSEKMRELWQK